MWRVYALFFIEWLAVWQYLSMHAILLQESIGPLDNQLNSLKLGGRTTLAYFASTEEDVRRDKVHCTLLSCGVCMCGIRCTSSLCCNPSWLSAILSGLNTRTLCWTLVYGPLWILLLPCLWIYCPAGCCFVALFGDGYSWVDNTDYVVIA